ncbi:MAG: hypothetical protein M3M96_04280, partial [Candidatus Eremiobacteraeota bacterium]|nr:hypothetical protein [Candidatus Eremiobacteraeota bacterium]
MDDAFKSSYIRPSADSVPSYWSYTYTSDAAPTSASVWHVLLYDFNAAQWKEVQKATGVSKTATGYGFIAFAAQYAQGACPSVPTIAADQIALFDAATKHFEPLAPTMKQGVTSTFIPPQPNASCFKDDGGATPNYQFATVPNSNWSVRAKTRTVVTEFFIPTPDSGAVG